MRFNDDHATGPQRVSLIAENWLQAVDGSVSDLLWKVANDDGHLTAAA